MTQSGAILTTTESIIFELCKTADRKNLKKLENNNELKKNKDWFVV